MWEYFEILQGFNLIKSMLYLLTVESHGYKKTIHKKNSVTLLCALVFFFLLLTSSQLMMIQHEGIT